MKLWIARYGEDYNLRLFTDRTKAKQFVQKRLITDYICKRMFLTDEMVDKILKYFDKNEEFYGESVDGESFVWAIYEREVWA